MNVKGPTATPDPGGGAGARRALARRARALASGTVSLARRGRAARAVSSRLGGRGWARVRRVTDARGAGESGLARVIDLHVVATVADTLVVTALASTIFFAVPTAQARGRVATSLVITMVPFILLAPVIGPLLDRVRHGRRYAIAGTLVVRAFLAWVMAGAVVGAGGSRAAFSLYPAAFGFLVCQKAYIVTRAAALPRVLPDGTGLVQANSRLAVAGVAAMTVAGGVGAGMTHWLGATWTLRAAFLVFTAGTVVALTLPARIDSSAGEVGTRGSGRPGWGPGSRVVLTLRANAALRAFTGFLTLFLAFRLRTEPLAGLSQTASVALVVVLAAAGGAVGTALGAPLRRARPEAVAALLLMAVTLIASWAAFAYGTWPVLAVALAAGFGQALGKLCLDSLIQTEVPERVRTSAFARSETVLQLAWVGGGGIGLALPLSGAWGLGIAAAGTAAVSVTVVAGLGRRARNRRSVAAAARPARSG